MKGVARKEIRVIRNPDTSGRVKSVLSTLNSHILCTFTIACLILFVLL